jgi:hypothetical protein
VVVETAAMVEQALRSGCPVTVLDAGVALYASGYHDEFLLRYLEERDAVMVLAALCSWKLIPDPYDIAHHVVTCTWRQVQVEQRRARRRKLTRDDVEAAWRSHWRGRASLRSDEHETRQLFGGRTIGSLQGRLVETGAIGGTGRRNGSSRTWPRATVLWIRNGRVDFMGRRHCPPKLPYGLRVRTHVRPPFKSQGWANLLERAEGGWW